MFSSPDNDPVKRFKVIRWISPFTTELLIILLFVTAGLILSAYAGTWPPVAAVIGNSMDPHMHDGDLVLFQSMSNTDLHTAGESGLTGYRTYNGYGDVIIFRPAGRVDVRPVIHRAMYYVNRSEPMYPDGPLAPHSGYITLGDNNHDEIDQYDYTGISPSQPIKEEWIIGVAKYNVPWLGWVRSALPV